MLKIRQLQKQKQKEAEEAGLSTNNTAKVLPAQLRLQKDITDLELPNSIKVKFDNPNDFFHFTIEISPTQGFYVGGLFKFSVDVNNNFPIDPPKIKCCNKIYHPNIDLEGNVCLNILRSDWSPALNLNSIIIGLNFLFLEPNPNDPLNKNAANVLVRSTENFRQDVRNSIRGGTVNKVKYDNVQGGK
jgi:ubiquitin-conjugating enzyme E2 M